MKSNVRDVVKRCARWLLGEYSIYHVYSSVGSAGNLSCMDPDVIELDTAQVQGCTVAMLAEQHGYAGDGAFAFGVVEGGKILALCFYWHGDRYRPRGFWPLADGQAKLVQIITTPAARGRGLARKLIENSARHLHNAGWKTLFARVWHSNEPSWRAFERAGWRRVALVIEVNPLRTRKPIRLRFPPRPSKVP